MAIWASLVYSQPSTSLIQVMLWSRRFALHARTRARVHAHTRTYMPGRSGMLMMMMIIIEHRCNRVDTHNYANQTCFNDNSGNDNKHTYLRIVIDIVIHDSQIILLLLLLLLIIIITAPASAAQTMAMVKRAAQLPHTSSRAPVWSLCVRVVADTRRVSTEVALGRGDLRVLSPRGLYRGPWVVCLWLQGCSPGVPTGTKTQGTSP